MGSQPALHALIVPPTEMGLALGISVRAVQRRIASGTIPSHRLGQRQVVLRPDWTDYLRAQRAAPPVDHRTELRGPQQKTLARLEARQEAVAPISESLAALTVLVGNGFHFHGQLGAWLVDADITPLASGERR